MPVVVDHSANAKMQLLKSKARISLPKIRNRKHDKDESQESRPHSHHHGHDHHSNNLLLILTKMKYKLQPRPKMYMNRASRPDKTQVQTQTHSESKLKEVFSRFDVDRDGWVDPWELGSLIRALGKNPTQAEIDGITTKEKLYGTMDFAQFVSVVEKYFLDGSDHDKEIQQAFEALGFDVDGYVSVLDLKLLLTTSGEKLDFAEFDQWIQEVAVGLDGRVRYEDVMRAL